MAIKNYGAYVARFALSYTDQGRDVYFNTGDMLSNQLRKYDVPFDASNVFLKVENLVFWGTWKTIYTQALAGYDQVCLELEGSSLNPVILRC